MNLKTGRCRLIVDGTALGDFPCAVELLDHPEPQSFGFLSGLTDQLKAVQIAKRVQADFGHGEIAEIRILQVSNTGVALITVRAIGDIEASSQNKADISRTGSSSRFGTNAVNTTDRVTKISEE